MSDLPQDADNGNWHQQQIPENDLGECDHATPCENHPYFRGNFASEGKFIQLIKYLATLVDHHISEFGDEALDK